MQLLLQCMYELKGTEKTLDRKYNTHVHTGIVRAHSKSIDIGFL